METWAIVTLVLGASAISALLTFFITKMQVNHSDKRFEKEHERAVVMYHRERRREVRGEPLLKLRAELARMATTQNLVLSAARGGSADQLKKALDDWNNYRASGNLSQTLFLQYDVELFNKVNEIQEKYLAHYENIMQCNDLNEAEREEAVRPLEKIWPKVVEVQSLINKELEEL